MTICARVSIPLLTIPRSGQTLTIEAEGTFAEKIEEGAFVWLTVKYGLIRLIYQKEDLCEQMKQVDTECPLGPGVVKITKDVDIPQQVPPVSGHGQLCRVSQMANYTPFQGKILCAGRRVY